MEHNIPKTFMDYILENGHRTGKITDEREEAERGYDKG